MFFFYLQKTVFILLSYLKSSDLLQFTGDTSKSHNTKSVDFFLNFQKLLLHKYLKFLRKTLTSF